MEVYFTPQIAKRDILSRKTDQTQENRLAGRFLVNMNCRVGKRSKKECILMCAQTQSPIQKNTPRSIAASLSQGRRKNWSYPIRYRLHRLGRRLSILWCVWQSSYMSFLGHMKNHNAKDFPSVCFGPALERLPDGSLRPVVRTQARTIGIDTLRATYPWVDTVDSRMFLMGFDAGEQWSRSSQGNAERTDVASA